MRKIIRWINRKILKKTKNTTFGQAVSINDGDSEEIGKIFLTHFIEIGGLNQHSDVLDVGSGFGRMALPLTTYLSPNSRYEGIEILHKGVDTCIEKIGSKFNNFNFHRIDVRNGRYNPGGHISAAEYVFPFEDQSFDFIFLTSVFTHMLPKDMENYVSEISRVIRPGATCFSTFFILNDQSLHLIESNISDFQLPYHYEGCRIESEEDPEYVVAYPENQLFSLFRKYDLSVKSVNYGNWCGRDKYTDFQDILVFKKTGS